MIKIAAPFKFKLEKKYIVLLIFSEFMGLDCQLSFENRVDYSISLGKHQFYLPDVFFAVDKKKWLTKQTLPQQPLIKWKITADYLTYKLIDTTIPILYGNLEYDQPTNDTLKIPLDIFGSAFFMLSRYEEVVKQNKDNYGRFPATASIAFQENFLERPIINEYIEILWNSLTFLCPNLKRKKRNFRIIPSHDADHPLHVGGMSFTRFLKYECGTFFRKGLSEIYNNFKEWNLCKKGFIEKDKFNTFNYIMDLSEKQNLKSCFYFLVDKCNGPMEIFSNAQDKIVQRIIKKIGERGHEVGLHATFNSRNNRKNILKEINLLKSICHKLELQQMQWGNRHHFLNLDVSETLKFYDDALIDYDATLGFPELIGFRCGICFEYTVFDIKTRKTLKLKERPLIIMDSTLMDKRYMDLGTGENALTKIDELKQKCRLFNGDFSILWHNNRFLDKDEINLYKFALSGN